MYFETSWRCTCQRRAQKSAVDSTTTEGHKAEPNDRARRRARDAGTIYVKGSGKGRSDDNVELSREAQPMHADKPPIHEIAQNDLPVYLPNRDTLEQNLGIIHDVHGDHYRFLRIVGGPGPMEIGDPDYFDD